MESITIEYEVQICYRLHAGNNTMSYVCDVPEVAADSDWFGGERAPTANQSYLLLTRRDLLEKPSLGIDPVTLYTDTHMQGETSYHNDTL